MKEIIKNFVLGFGSMFDFTTDKYNPQKYIRNIRSWESDKENISNDWKRVGGDIQLSMNKVMYDATKH